MTVENVIKFLIDLNDNTHLQERADSVTELEVITQIANEEGYKFTVEEWKSGIKEAKATLAEGENYVRETGAPIGVAEEVLGMEYLEEELLS